MPRRKKGATAEPDRLAILPSMVGSSMVMGGETTEERRERELEDILTELGSDTRVKVYHVVDGKPVYAGEIPAEGFTLDSLLDAFGGGDKTLAFYQGKEKKDITRVALDPTVPIKSPRTTGARAAATPGGGNNFGDMAALIAAMAQASMSSTQMMHTMMAASQGQMTMMLNAVTAMMAANKGTDPMEMAVKIGELMRTNSPTGAKELLEVFEKGMSMRDKLGGGEDGDGVMDIASKGLDIVGKLVAANNQPNGHRPPMIAPPRQPSPQLPPAAPPSIVVASPPSQDRAWVAAARPSFPLLSLSIGNVRPATAVDVLADRMTDDQFDDLLDDIEAGTPDEFIGRFESYFAVTVKDEPTRDWLRQLVAALLATVESDDAAHDAVGVTDADFQTEG
jgi:hypothetical protein